MVIKSVFLVDSISTSRIPILAKKDSFHQQEEHPGLKTSSKWFYLAIVSPKSR